MINVFIIILKLLNQYSSLKLEPDCQMPQNVSQNMTLNEGGDDDFVKITDESLLKLNENNDGKNGIMARFVIKVEELKDEEQENEIESENDEISEDDGKWDNLRIKPPAEIKKSDSMRVNDGMLNIPSRYYMKTKVLFNTTFIGGDKY